MKLIVAALLIVASANAQNLVAQTGGKRCPIGDRGKFGDDVVFNNIVNALCYDTEASCVYFMFNLTDAEGRTFEMDFGDCVSAGEEYDCSEVEKRVTEKGYGTVSACKKVDAELYVDEAPEECGLRNEDDLLVSPQCTMRDIFVKMGDCAQNYYANFPYDDRSVCESEVDMMFKCHAQVASECSTGRCPTVFDDIPGAREQFGYKRDWAFNVTDVKSFYQNMVDFKWIMANETDYYRDMTMDKMCRGNGDIPMWVTELPEYTEQFWGNVSMMVDFNFMDFLNAIPCRESYFENINNAMYEAVYHWYNATEHDQVCTAFDTYKSKTSMAVLRDCSILSFNYNMFDDVLPEEYRGAGQAYVRAMQIWGEYFWQYQLPGCNKISSETTVACVTGDRVSVNGDMLWDNTVNSLCPTIDNLCTEYQYTLMSMDEEGNPQEIKINGGACTRPERTYNCSAVQQYQSFRSPGAMVTNCNVSDCYGNYCAELKATPAQGCSLFTSDDVQLMPGCTLKETMYKFNECYEKFYSNFPYQNQDVCGSRRTELFQCLSRTYSTCLSGRCPTVLDQIPGTRSFYPLMQELTYDISSINEVMDRMVALYLVDEQTAMQIAESVNFAFCPQMRDLPAMVQSWFDNFNTSDAMMWFASMNITLVDIQQNMPCSVSYYTTIASAWQQMVVELFTEGDLCSAYDRYFEKVTKAYVENCDDSKIEGWLYLVMPDEYDMFVPYVKMAMEYVGKYFYENPRLPGCDAGNGGNGGNVDMDEISCDKFYKSQTRCGMKKAWLCDYAKWKKEFLGSWIGEYNNYLENTMMSGVSMDDLPPCMEKSAFNGMCKNRRQLTCFNIPVQNCPMCYCADHEYTDLSGLSSIYRYDYQMWQKFFRSYRQHSGMHSGMNGSCDA